MYVILRRCFSRRGFFRIQTGLNIVFFTSGQENLEHRSIKFTQGQDEMGGRRWNKVLLNEWGIFQENGSRSAMMYVYIYVCVCVCSTHAFYKRETGLIYPVYSSVAKDRQTEGSHFASFPRKWNLGSCKVCEWIDRGE